jgi:hypothetical protein
VFTGHLDRPNNRPMMLPVEGGQEPTIITPPHMNAKRPTWLSSGGEIAFNRDQTTIWTLGSSRGMRDFTGERRRPAAITSTLPA